MRNNAIVLLYAGNMPSDEQIRAIATAAVDCKVCVPEMLEIKYLDSDAIAKSMVEKLLPEKDEVRLAKVYGISQFHDINKIEAIKLIKEILGVSIQEARGIIDSNRITLRDATVKNLIWPKLLQYGFYPTDWKHENITKKMAAAIVICGNYGSDDRRHLIADYMDARDAIESCRTDKQKALINAVEIVSTMDLPEVESHGIPSILAKTCRELIKLI